MLLPSAPPLFRSSAWLLALLPSLLLAGSAFANESASCTSPEATEAYQSGFSAQKSRDADAALGHYRRCLELEPDCLACNYEIGWSYWTRGAWDSTVTAWSRTLELDPNHEDAKTWLVQAKDQQRRSKTRSSDSLRIPMGTASSPDKSPVQLKLVARFQNYKAEPTGEGDTYDKDIYSPKSARFSADGSKVYVNSLEGFRTPVYDTATLTKTGVIKHRFTSEEGALFAGQTTIYDYKYYKKHSSGDVNRFSGKPVESALSHGGRYLWVPYYRRDWDGGGTSPSAVAIIEVATDTIVRVMPTGPIPKYVSASPDGNWVAVTHWGNNSVAMIDVRSGDPASFEYTGPQLIVEKRLSQVGLQGEDRDKACGYCLRGTVFTADSKTLLVSRMGGGGIAGFDVATGEYLGTVLGMKPTPRHLVLSGDGATLFLSSNVSGYVSRIDLPLVVDALRAADGKRVTVEGWQAVYVGIGARTISTGPGDRYIFSAVNGASEIVVIDAATMNIVSRVRTDSYTVGLAVSPDGTQVWTTSQGRKGAGGNSVCVYAVEYTR
ncbi:MAG: peptidoglycan-binding protein [Proteobacteria bacterium]|nr:peptidoglycan-binding protein [Pseudomonadota bacterium]